MHSTLYYGTGRSRFRKASAGQLMDLSMSKGFAMLVDLWFWFGKTMGMDNNHWWTGYKDETSSESDMIKDKDNNFDLNNKLTNTFLRCMMIVMITNG